ncbi:dihydropteroate synthase [Paenibacillus albiflavus]|uniref:Dihydropteroate synthase n=1 Tax=Paenibacillus albiflavus TaxID=2545760 RepID=A0A4R4E978_9BACL|nr:dihydropteroate synthase [Paenibacillus albiflavus]TCZ74345.1 dihydropteroate synthase [Paenibacillus albiflavus]
MIRTLTYGNHTIELGRRTLVMGILNITPDSFSDGGSYHTIEDAVKRAFEMVEQGADIIDIGGESTRPDAAEVSEQEELMRVIPVIKALTEAGLSVPISIDTYKAEVADQAMQAGASIINDVWGFKREPRIAQVAAHYRCPVILMHNRTDMDYQDYLSDVLSDLSSSVAIAREAGVEDKQIILDPGFGFVKTYEHNIWLMNHLREIVDLGYPVLLGTSRKRMIYHTLNLPKNELIEGTAATVVLGIAQGCDIVRVHDVKEIKRTVTMTDAIIRNQFTF